MTLRSSPVDVEQCVLDRLGEFYGPSRAADEQRGEWVDALKPFSRQVMRDAATRIIRTRRTKTWPSLADVLTACKFATNAGQAQPKANADNHGLTVYGETVVDDPASPFRPGERVTIEARRSPYHGRSGTVASTERYRHGVRFMIRVVWDQPINGVYRECWFYPDVLGKPVVEPAAPDDTGDPLGLESAVI